MGGKTSIEIDARLGMYLAFAHYMIGSRGLRLVRIFGIDITVDPSWIFIAVLMSWSLTAAFSHLHREWSPVLALGTAVMACLLFFISVLLHELAHSLVAQRYGVAVSRITLFLFGGVSNIEREPPSPAAEFVTAVVGPATSIILGFLLLWLGSAVVPMRADTFSDPEAGMAALSPAQSLLLWLGPINIFVGAFNLIPGFPLDGGRMLHAVLWAISHDMHAATRWASAIGQAIGWALVFAGVAIIFGVRIPFLGQGIVSGLWLAFIGWFLSSAALQMSRREVAREALEGVPVSRLMSPAAPAVPPKLDLDTLVSEWMIRSGEWSFPVVGEDGAFLGLITLGDVRRVPRSQWASTRVSDVMTPRDKLASTTPREDLAEAMQRVARVDVGQLPVLDPNQRLVGMLQRRDALRWIELHGRQNSARGYAH